MLDLNLIDEARKSAKAKYLEALKSLGEPNENTDVINQAQLANDAYLEFKKLDREYEDRRILNKMEQLFGC